MYLAILRHVVIRDDVKAIFDVAWRLLESEDQHFLQMIIPFCHIQYLPFDTIGRALAKAEDQQERAECLLQRLTKSIRNHVCHPRLSILNILLGKAAQTPLDGGQRPGNITKP